MVMRGSLTALLTKAQQGDGAAWKNIVERFSPWALGLARRRLPAGRAAEDAVQEAFLATFRRLGDLRSKEAFPSWLASIIISQCSRLAGSLPPEVSLERLDVCGLMPQAVSLDPEDALHASEFLAAFDAALGELPAHLRDVCRLHYRRGMSVPEVAQACALPEGTVKKRLFTARPLLQARLAHYRGEGLFRVGYMPVSDHLLAMCADHMGRGRGLPLHSRRYLSWASLAGDLERGRLDAAFIMAPLALAMYQSGARLLYVLDGHHDGSSLAVSRRAERTRRMGLPDDRSTHRVLLSRLGQQRPAEYGDLPTLVVNPSSAISSMRQNAIGSFFCAEPWSAKCAQEGIGDTAIRSRDILPGHLCCILAVREDFAQRRDTVVTDYVRAIFTARDKVRRDPAHGARVQAACTGIGEDVARIVLDQGGISFDDLEPDADRMDDFARMAVEAGVLQGPLDISGFVCREFCARA